MAAAAAPVDGAHAAPEIAVGAAAPRFLAYPRPLDLNGEIAAGRYIARYTAARRVGQGAFGDVYDGNETATGRRVAIKVLHENGHSLPRGTADRRLALLQEVYVLRRIRELNNPNILRLLAAFEEPGSVVPGVPRIVHVTDFCAGGELFDRLVNRGVAFSEAEVARIIAKIARALQQLHDMGIIHRDLKSENILFSSPDDAGEPILSDLGLAMIERESDPFASRGFVGTPVYCAPEVLRQTYFPHLPPLYSRASDVWTLGTIICVLLTGTAPFNAVHEIWDNIHRDRPHIFNRIQRGELIRDAQAVLAGLSPGAREVVSNMLSPDPARRMTLTQLLEHPWIKDNTSTAALPLTLENMRAFVRARHATTAALSVASAPFASARQRLLRALGVTVLPRVQPAAGGAGVGAEIVPAPVALAAPAVPAPAPGAPDDGGAAALARLGLNFLPRATYEDLPRLVREVIAAVPAPAPAPAAAVAGGIGTGEGAGALPPAPAPAPGAVAPDAELSLTEAQFTALMQRLNLGKLPLKHIFSMLDEARAGSIQYRDFVVALSALHAPDDHEIALRCCFSLFADGGGYVTQRQLEQLLTSLNPADHEGAGAGGDLGHRLHEAVAEAQGVSAAPGAVLGVPALEAAPAVAAELDEHAARVVALRALFEMVDGARDGRISFEEFATAVRMHPALRPFLLSPVHYARSRMPAAAAGAAVV